MQMLNLSSSNGVTLSSTTWPAFLSAALLVAVRISGIFVFAPVFSSSAIPVRIKAGFVVVITVLLAPVAATLPGARPELGLPSVLGELGLALVFGLSLSLLNEIALFAGQLVGIQFSFSLVNLLDPNSQVQTQLFGQMFGLLNTTVLVAAGLHRTMLASLMRSFAFVPVGTAVFAPQFGMTLVYAAGGVFLASLQLAAPVMASTMLVEVAIASMARISPQLPVLPLTVPAKTAVGYVVLIGSLALWPAFFEARFSGLLEMADTLLRQCGRQG
jgi:flagellar biosynthesis protein FliR